MTDEPNVPLTELPSDDPGETLKPVELVEITDETASVLPGAAVPSPAIDPTLIAAPHPALSPKGRGLAGSSPLPKGERAGRFSPLPKGERVGRWSPSPQRGEGG